MKYTRKFKAATGLPNSYFTRNGVRRYFTETHLKQMVEALGKELPPPCEMGDVLDEFGLVEVRKYTWK